jgi:hypothetical protein
MLRFAATLFLLAALVLPVFTQSKRHAPPPSKIAPAARNSSERAIQQAIFELEQTWLDALVRRDQPAVAAILAPEFHDTTMTGQVHDRQQALAAVLDTTRPDFQRAFGRLDVQAYEGRFAVARGIVLVSGPNIHQARIAFTDAFVLRDGKWQAVAAQEVLVQ